MMQSDAISLLSIVQERGTPLKGVTKLDPGSAILVRDGTIIRRWAYYEPPFLSQTPVRQVPMK